MIDYTIFFDACMNEPLSEVESFFVPAAVDVNAVIESGITALFMTVLRNRLDIAEYLIAKGADVNARTDSGHNPLHWAASKGHEDLATLLIAKGADVNARTDSGHTSLHLATFNGYGGLAALLIAKGADVNAKDIKLCTPADLERLEADYAEARSPLEQSEIICSLRRMERVRRNSFLGRVQGDSFLCRNAVRLVISNSV